MYVGKVHEDEVADDPHPTTTTKMARFTPLFHF